MLSALYHQVQFRICILSLNTYQTARVLVSTRNRSDKASEHDDDTISTDSKSISSSGSDTSFPEEPTTCCMSGCANCVWLDYVDKVNAYFRDGGDQAMKEIEERVQDPSMKAFLMSELRMRDKLKDDD